MYEGRAAIGTFPGSMEVYAHLANGAAGDAAELVARQWGYMLSCPNSTGSTFWEGFQADGQYAFQGIYMSHAHGWATGPAGALSAYALGLRRGPGAAAGDGAGAGYVVAPSPSSSMRWCNGSRAFGGDGRIEVAWRDHTAAEDGDDATPLLFSLTVDATGYNGIGRIALPLRGRSADTVDVATAGGRGALTQVGVDEAGERLWFELKGAHRVVLEVSAKKCEKMILGIFQGASERRARRAADTTRAVRPIHENERRCQRRAECQRRVRAECQRRIRVQLHQPAIRRGRRGRRRRGEAGRRGR